MNMCMKKFDAEKKDLLNILSTCYMHFEDVHEEV